jgi:hypothetical protein
MSVSSDVEMIVRQGELIPEQVDLGLQGHDLDPLRIGKNGALIEVCRHPGQPVGERSAYLRAVPGHNFLLGGMELVPERSVVYLEPECRGGLFGKLGFEAINRGGLFAEFRKLARVLGPELLYDEFEPARHDCKIGTRLIFVGLDFHHRWRNVSFDPAQRQSDRAGMDRRNGGESEQARGEKASPIYMAGSIRENMEYASGPARPPRQGKDATRKG